MKPFKFLSKDEFLALKDAERKAYLAQVNVYIKEHRATHPNGQTVSYPINSMSLRPNRYGKIAIVCETGVDSYNPGGAFNYTVGQINNMADKAGFFGAVGLRAAIVSSVKKNKLTLVVKPVSITDEYTVDGVKENYTTPHYRFEDDAIEASLEGRAVASRIMESAALAEARQFMGSLNPVGVPVAETDDDL